MKRISIILLFLCLGGNLSAQSSDWGGVISVDLEKKLTKKLSVSFWEEMRLNNDFGDIERFAHSLGMEYKLSKYLKAGISYSLMNKNVHYEKTWNNGDVTLKNYWQTRHQGNLFVTGNCKLSDFKLSLRERLQYTAWDKKKYKKVEDVRTWIEESSDKILLRSRFQVKYDRKSCAWEPFASVELMHLLERGTYNDDNDVEQEEKTLDGIRYVAGTAYKINKKHSVELYYRYDDNRNGDGDINRLGIGYAFKF